MTEPIILDLDDLSTDIPALTGALALQMQEAVVMCMNSQEKSSGVSCDLRNLDEALGNLRILWKMSYSERIRRAFGDSRNAAERAGEAIAILTVLAFTDYTVIERARIGSGFDFWLSRTDDNEEYLFQHEMGLESKGLSHAKYPSQIVTAVRDGLAQIRKSKYAKLPALVVATEFSRPVIYMVQYEP
ncbi:MAG: hypothetical protein OXE46_07635 [Chloroflexi bacterium]|nr:hypothetical protein [Chloroflexota bacterium]